MKKKVLIISSVFVVLLFALMVYFFTPNSVMQMEFEKDVTVANGDALTDELNYEIVIDKAGTYNFRAKWETTPSGLITGLRITDEAGEEVFAATADTCSMEFHPRELQEGTYTMTLTFITNNEQWEAFKVDTKDWDVVSETAYQFMPDGEFKIHYSFELEENINIGNFAVVGMMLGVGLAIIIIFAACHKGDSMKHNYDERQELVRGRGFKYAFFVMIIWNVVLFFFECAEVPLPFNVGIGSMLSALFGVSVYAVYCVWNDAYFALNQKVGTLIVIILFGGGVNLLLGIHSFMDGNAVRDGELTLRSLNLFCGIMVLVICGTMLLKRVCRDREEE